MAKIQITRLPNATPEYDPSQFDQMIKLLEQIILLLNTNYQQDLKEDSESEAFFLGYYFYRTNVRCYIYRSNNNINSAHS